MGFWNLFQWEIEKLDAMLVSLREVHLSKHSIDRTWWHFNIKGEFSVKSFVNAWWGRKRRALAEM